MSTVHFVDTSVLVELLNVPGMNQRYEQAKSEYERLAANQDTFVLPIAVLVETGNHIGQISDGSKRYEISDKFSQIVKKAIYSEDHWNAVPELPASVLEHMMDGFCDWTKHSSGFGDMSIVQQFEEYWQKRQPIGKMRIWSFDTHLSAYEKEGGLSRRKNK